MAFAGGHFYLGNQGEVRRYPWREGQARLEGEGERITELPGGGYNQHWTRNVVLAPDGERLFVTVGSRTNAEPEPEPRASIFVMALDGSERRTFASGLRNPVGLAFHPRTGALYATVNERDHLGDGLVPDFFARIEDGAFYGWPWAYLAPGNVDPRLRDRPRELVRRTRTPEVLFEAHSAALGLAFYDADAFPARYRGGAFVAHRGSWNRSRGTGYRIVFVPFDGDAPRGTYEPFVGGFLIDPAGPTTWGRPVGVLATPDGALLFTDETGGRVYRVSYRG
jgi:glucose/arabinose dehydrogenase